MLSLTLLALFVLIDQLNNNYSLLQLFDERKELVSNWVRMFRYTKQQQQTAIF